jgi:hypothetical protein
MLSIGTPCGFPTGDSFIEQMYPDAGRHVGRDIGILAAFFVIVEVTLLFLSFSHASQPCPPSFSFLYDIGRCMVIAPLSCQNPSII